MSLFMATGEVRATQPSFPLNEVLTKQYYNTLQANLNRSLNLLHEQFHQIILYDVTKNVIQGMKNNKILIIITY